MSSFSRRFAANDAALGVRYFSATYATVLWPREPQEYTGEIRVEAAMRKKQPNLLVAAIVVVWNFLWTIKRVGQIVD